MDRQKEFKEFITVIARQIDDSLQKFFTNRVGFTLVLYAQREDETMSTFNISNAEDYAVIEALEKVLKNVKEERHKSSLVVSEKPDEFGDIKH